MSMREFELMEHPFGWKAEYCQGKAMLTPREFYVATKLKISPRSADTNYLLVPADPTLKQSMISAFFESFRDSVEFCNWPIPTIKKHAEKNINNYFDGVRGKPLSVSVIAVEPDSDRIAGLALFNQNRRGDGETNLDLLFVRPLHQRKGLATAMVSAAVNQLKEQGIEELCSGFHVCNQNSEKWHHAFGFQDVYDQFYIRLKCAWFRHEIWRHEQLGLPDRVEELTRQRDYWQSQIKEDWTSMILENEFSDEH